MIRLPFSKSYTVKCKDGTTRQVFKNFDDALPLALPGFKASSEANLELEKQAKATLKGEYSTQVQGLIFAINDSNESLMMSFRAAYLVYHSNPCGNDQVFVGLMKAQIEHHQRLVSARLQMSKIIELASMQNASKADVSALMQAVVTTIGGTSVAEGSRLEISSNADLMRQWVGEGDDE